jgi:hypothetical protein
MRLASTRDRYRVGQAEGQDGSGMRLAITRGTGWGWPG